MSNTYKENLLTRINQAKHKAVSFFNSLETNQGYKYTVTHNVEKYPAALLYGSWSVVLGMRLIRQLDNWSDEKKGKVAQYITCHRQEDGIFYSAVLKNKRHSKSSEYLKLHCTNYAMGAMLELKPDYNWRIPALTPFLDEGFLARWLEGRSFKRPWEEGNNIVNVASFLALYREHSIPGAEERLLQLLNWHRKYQNKETGGFDAFTNPSHRHRLQSLAGAVHNFHLHLYLGEDYGCERIIAQNLPYYLNQGRLTACLSLDFVELAVRTLQYSQNAQSLVNALLYHAECLLRSQREDSGWLEAENDNSPTIAAGFTDEIPSSCSYATWFRLASLGMIAIVLLSDPPSNWGFRKTLGMGYAPDCWPDLPNGVVVSELPLSYRLGKFLKTLPAKGKKRLIQFGGKLL